MMMSYYRRTSKLSMGMIQNHRYNPSNINRGSIADQNPTTRLLQSKQYNHTSSSSNSPTAAGFVTTKIDEPAPRLKTIFNNFALDQKSNKMLKVFKRRYSDVSHLTLAGWTIYDIYQSVPATHSIITVDGQQERKWVAAGAFSQTGTKVNIEESVIFSMERECEDGMPEC